MNEELQTKIVDYLIWNFEKVALKTTLSGEIYAKVYSSAPKEEVLEKITSKFDSEEVLFESYKQDPPFIDDDIDALEVMITTDKVKISNLLDAKNKYK